ncbi:MAG: hypothetical protein OHK0039_20640 [Bacteroidia bacterium]
MKKTLRMVLLVLLGALVVIQFIRPAKNQSSDAPGDMAAAYPVPDEVASILKVACNDCHSNYTRYPWYSNIQPVGWWLDHHVDEGKGHLNFSTFTQNRIAVQNHKFEEIVETVEEGEMPLDSYTWTHTDARLSPEQRALVIDWARTQMDSLRARYPADSLILRRRQPAPQADAGPQPRD